jgi:hypothetical protein
MPSPLITDRDRNGGPTGRARAVQAARRAGSRIRTARATDGDGFDRLYHNRHRTSTVPDRVLDQVAEYLVHLVGIQPGLGQLPGDHHPEPVPGLPGGDPPGDDLLHPFGNADELAVDLHPAGLDAGHVQQLGDEPGDPVGVGVDGLQHDPLLVVGEPGPLGQQRRRETLHAGQRGPQLMRDGGDQVGPAALQPGPLLRSAQADHEMAQGPGPLR